MRNEPAVVDYDHSLIGPTEIKKTKKNDLSIPATSGKPSKERHSFLSVPQREVEVEEEEPIPQRGSGRGNVEEDDKNEDEEKNEIERDFMTA